MAVAKLSSEEHRQSLGRIQAILEGETIDPVYQPIYELDSGRAIACEALSRFPGDPQRGPDRWFAEAWDVGLGVPLELLAVRIAATALPGCRPASASASTRRHQRSSRKGSSTAWAATRTA